MKKMLILCISFIIVLSIAGCSDRTVKENGEVPDIASKEEGTEEVGKSNNKEKTQEQINQELREKAIRADFTVINSEEETDGLAVFAEGEISVVDYKGSIDIDVFPSFLLSQEEGDGFGVYHISNILSVDGLEDGDEVIVYGTVDSTIVGDRKSVV